MAKVKPEPICKPCNVLAYRTTGGLHKCPKCGEWVRQ